MFAEMKRFLNEESRGLSGEQVRGLLLYMAFLLRFCEKFGVDLEEDVELIGLLPELFRKIEGYEIKEAAFVFDASVPWNIVEKDKNLHDGISKRFYKLYKNEYFSAKWLLNTVSEITEERISTPRLVRRLIAEAATQTKVDKITDLCSGTFLLGLEVWNKSEDKDGVECYGEENDPYLCAISRLLLFLCDVKNFTIKEEDVLNNAAPKSFSQSSKVIVADIPLVGNRTISVSRDDTFLSEKKRTLYADWMIIYRILQQLNSGERAFLLVTKGALVRENEHCLRKYFTDYDWVDTVITLPNRVYPNYNSPMNLLIFQKDRPNERKGKILFMDLNMVSEDFSNNDIVASVSRMFKEYTGGEFARLVDYEEAVRREYTLYPPIYLSDKEVLSRRFALRDVACVIRGIQDLSANKAVNTKERYLLNVRDIKDGEIVYETAEIINSGNPAWEEKFRIREDDIIITSKGAAMKLAIVPPNPKAAYISGNLMIIRVDADRYSPYVLYEYLMSEEGQAALNLIQTGSTTRVLGIGKTERLALPEYDRETVKTIGERLKLATICHRQALQEVYSSFERKKQELLFDLNKRKGNKNV